MARKLFGAPMNKMIEWDSNKTVFDNFMHDKHIKEFNDALERLDAVALPRKLGLSHYRHLSNGEKERATLARLLAPNMIFDEFTSFVSECVNILRLYICLALLYFDFFVILFIWLWLWL